MFNNKIELLVAALKFFMIFSTIKIKTIPFRVSFTAYFWFLGKVEPTFKPSFNIAHPPQSTPPFFPFLARIKGKRQAKEGEEGTKKKKDDERRTNVG